MPSAARPRISKRLLADLRALRESMRRPLMNWHLFNEPKLEQAWAEAVDTWARENGLGP